MRRWIILGMSLCSLALVGVLGILVFGFFRAPAEQPQGPAEWLIANGGRDYEGPIGLAEYRTALSRLDSLCTEDEQRLAELASSTAKQTWTGDPRAYHVLGLVTTLVDRSGSDEVRDCAPLFAKVAQAHPLPAGE